MSPRSSSDSASVCTHNEIVKSLLPSFNGSAAGMEIELPRPSNFADCAGKSPTSNVTARFSPCGPVATEFLTSPASFQRATGPSAANELQAASCAVQKKTKKRKCVIDDFPDRPISKTSIRMTHAIRFSLSPSHITRPAIPSAFSEGEIHQRNFGKPEAVRILNL